MIEQTISHYEILENPGDGAWALLKEPGERYQSAQELINDLRASYQLSSLPITIETTAERAISS